MTSSRGSIFFALVFSSFLLYTKSCEPDTIFYPKILNIQLLSTSESQVLLTMEDEDETDFCVTYDWDATPSFSDNVDCVSYTSYIIDGASSDTDPASSRINSISADNGLDMTRNHHSFVIPWSDFPDDVTAVTIDDGLLQSFTFNSADHYVTFISLSVYDVYAIKFESETSNNYQILAVEGNDHFDTALESSHVQIYDDYGLVMFEDTAKTCSPMILCEYEVNLPSSDTYSFNFTEIVSGFNVVFDTRTTGYVYIWGNSKSLMVFDIAKPSLYPAVYGLDETASNAYSWYPKKTLCVLHIVIYLYSTFMIE
eukprot:661326_1